MPEQDQGFDMEADANQQAPVDPNQLANMERQQRKAYWKGEQQAERRLPQFTPRDPLAGAALQESHRIEEAVWQKEQEAEEEAAWQARVAWEDEVEAQGMADTLKGEGRGAGEIPDSEIINARKNLAEVNRWGGEMDDNSVDQFIIQVADAQNMRYGARNQLLSERPRYEQKSEFYKWLRKLESNARGEKDRDIVYRQPEPTPEEKEMERQNKGRYPSRPLSDELPEGQSIG